MRWGADGSPGLGTWGWPYLVRGEASRMVVGWESPSTSLSPSPVSTSGLGLADPLWLPATPSPCPGPAAEPCKAAGCDQGHAEVCWPAGDRCPGYVAPTPSPALSWPGTQPTPPTAGAKHLHVAESPGAVNMLTSGPNPGGAKTFLFQ